MYNGCTGEAMDALVFIGPTYYQRLRHMVRDKWHSRGGHGPVTTLTRQPLEGRAKDGGLRFGEMEKDATLAHGAAFMLKQKLDSDKTLVHICDHCGAVADAPPPRDPEGRPYCRACKSHDTPKPVEMPYATKLLFQELEAMMVRVRPHLEPVDPK